MDVGVSPMGAEGYVVKGGIFVLLKTGKIIVSPHVHCLLNKIIEANSNTMSDGQHSIKPCMT